MRQVYILESQLIISIKSNCINYLVELSIIFEVDSDAMNPKDGTVLELVADIRHKHMDT